MRRRFFCVTHSRLCCIPWVSNICFFLALLALTVSSSVSELLSFAIRSDSFLLTLDYVFVNKKYMKQMCFIMLNYLYISYFFCNFVV